MSKNNKSVTLAATGDIAFIGSDGFALNELVGFTKPLFRETDIVLAYLEAPIGTALLRWERSIFQPPRKLLHRYVQSELL